jgi:hypothetical protein
MEDATNARHMLRKQAVVEGAMGPRLAAYLVEHLPFETEPEQQIETIRLVLQPGLLDRGAIDALWRKAQRKPAYYVGFVAACPDELPEGAEVHPLAQLASLEALANQGNAVARLLIRVCSGEGQAYLATLARIFEKPSNQEVVNTTLDAIAGYFAAVRPEGRVDMTLEALHEDAAVWLGTDADARLVSRLPEIAEQQVVAMRVLSGLSYGVVRPVFGDSTAMGSLMRRKLQPVLEPLLDTLGSLSAGKRVGPATEEGLSRRRHR